MSACFHGLDRREPQNGKAKEHISTEFDSFVGAILPVSGGI